MSNKYLNYIDGEFRHATDDEFQKVVGKITFELVRKELEKHLRNNDLRDSDYFLESSREENNNDIFILKNNNGNKISLLHRALKNSGITDNDNKRFQVYENGVYEKDIENYLLGSYLVGDELYFVLLDDEIFFKNYVDKKEEGRSYSSAWVNFDLIQDMVDTGSSIGTNNVSGNMGRFRVGFKGENIRNALDFISNLNYTPTLRESARGPKKESLLKYYEFPVESFDLAKHSVSDGNNLTTKRNQLFIKTALNATDDLCEYSPKHKSFEKEDGSCYSEGHHLIPMNYKIQKNFDKRLDHPINIFKLCPNCHREMHFGKKENKIKKIEYLYNKRKTEYEKLDVNSANQILDQY